MLVDAARENEALDPYSARVAAAVERVGPAAVHVAVAARSDRPAGCGSGVFFTPDGYLLTNYHVIAGRARVTASLSDGRTPSMRNS
jgi:S1-C subfamily serine protease